MRTSSLCAVALCVLAVAAANGDASNFYQHDYSKTMAERQLEINVCRDLGGGRNNGTTYVCMRSANIIATQPNCDDEINNQPNPAAGINQAGSYCCNKTLASPQGILPLPNASQGNCCPGSPVEYTSCGVPPAMLCCHPTLQTCRQPNVAGVDFGECVDLSQAPTTLAPTGTPTSAPTFTVAPTDAPTQSPTGSPTSTRFLDCPDGKGGSYLPLLHDGDLVQCGCASTCPSGSYCSFQLDPFVNVIEGYCCPGAQPAVDACQQELDCGKCNQGCEWYGMQGCQFNASLTAVEDACHVCPSNTTAPNTPQEIKTGVPGTCMRRCNSIGEKRYSRPRDLDYSAAIRSDDPLRWLYIPPNPYDPYYNLYGNGYVPPPPPPPPLPPPMGDLCSCDDECAEIANADCCNDYDDLCVF